uniref:Uncharacterized protein n=1 Tax=Panagrolaimus superbus TaxID=310955 RepID=A0A914XYL0_9BILA
MLDTVEHKTKIELFTLDLMVSSPFFDIIVLWKFMKDNAKNPPWTKKHYSGTTPAWFEINLKNANSETNFSRNGNTLFGYYRFAFSSHPYIIPHYDENEFFKNNVIQRLV